MLINPKTMTIAQAAEGRRIVRAHVGDASTEKLNEYKARHSRAMDSISDDMHEAFRSAQRGEIELDTLAAKLGSLVAEKERHQIWLDVIGEVEAAK